MTAKQALVSALSEEFPELPETSQQHQRFLIIASKN